MNGKTPLYLSALLFAVLAATMLLVQPYSFRWADSADSSALSAPMRRYFGAAFREEPLGPPSLSLTGIPARWDSAMARRDSAR